MQTIGDRRINFLSRGLFIDLINIAFASISCYYGEFKF